MSAGAQGVTTTYILLLFMDMADLEPDVLLGQWFRRVLHNISEALQHVSPDRRCCADSTYLETLAEFLLLFVYYAETKVDLVCLFKVWLHTHNLRKGFLGVV